MYAINAAVFVVITESRYTRLRELLDPQEVQSVAKWREELLEIGGFEPVIVGRPLPRRTRWTRNASRRWTASASSRCTTVRRWRRARSSPRRSAPIRRTRTITTITRIPRRFLRGGGRRGRQYVPLTDGTYFINRWFAKVELIPKTVVPIGYVGVVVSYYGRQGQDVSGDGFRHGERVAEGERGVWEQPLGPGKYPFNTYAGSIVLVPTTNFVLALDHGQDRVASLRREPASRSTW